MATSTSPADRPPLWAAPPSYTVASARASPCLRVRTSSVGILAPACQVRLMPCGASISASGTSAVPWAWRAMKRRASTPVASRISVGRASSARPCGRPR
ncbi:Uncharacterised protein [Bordetella pertussis]|nr:Uncharacterised protein [Bordetella pertussis]CFW37172.1 Uncharacterised protein [Bordetella pertussis]